MKKLKKVDQQLLPLRRAIRGHKGVLYEPVKVIAALALFVYVCQRDKQRSTPLSTSIAFPQPVNNSAGWMMIDETKPALFESTKSDIAKRKTKVFCLCSTTRLQHEDRAIYVRRTWGRRCDKLFFASDFADPFLPSGAFWNETGRPYVSFKIFAAWQWVHDHYLDDYEWFLKADDDTFVIMENLRLFLDKFDHNGSHFFGRPLSSNQSVYHVHYVSGAAYILSRSSLSRLVKESFPDKVKCPGPKKKGNEDARISYCLLNIGISAKGSLDERKRNRFLIFNPWGNLLPGASQPGVWIWRYDKAFVEGEECCSDRAISIHDMKTGGKLFAVEFLLYRLRPFGVSNSVMITANGT